MSRIEFRFESDNPSRPINSVQLKGNEMPADQPIFGSPSFTKYAFGCYDMITVTNPEPVEYVQLWRDSDVIVLRRVTEPNTVECFTQARFHELMLSRKITVDRKRFDISRQKAPLVVADPKRRAKTSHEELDGTEFYGRLIDSLNKFSSAS